MKADVNIDVSLFGLSALQVVIAFFLVIGIAKIRQLAIRDRSQLNTKSLGLHLLAFFMYVTTSFINLFFYANYIAASGSQKTRAEYEFEIASMSAAVISMFMGLILCWILWHLCNKPGNQIAAVQVEMFNSQVSQSSTSPLVKLIDSDEVELQVRIWHLFVRRAATSMVESVSSVEDGVSFSSHSNTEDDEEAEPISFD